jgi:hypothetical protein
MLRLKREKLQKYGAVSPIQKRSAPAVKSFEKYLTQMFWCSTIGETFFTHTKGKQDDYQTTHDHART